MDKLTVIGASDPNFVLCEALYALIQDLLLLDHSEREPSCRTPVG